MRVLVTGASGHIGANLVRELVEQGYAVKALIHQTSKALSDLPVEMVQGDILDYEALKHAFAGVDLVFHAAGYISIRSDEWEKLKVMNVYGVYNVIRACIACGVKRLVHFSSIEAIDRGARAGMVDETYPHAIGEQQSPYALSKAFGQELIQSTVQNGFNAIILNPTSIIGPYDYKIGKSTQAILDIYRGKLPVLVEGCADWVDVRDVARAAITAAHQAPPGSQYILSGHKVSIQELADKICALKGSHAPGIYLPLGIVKLFTPLAELYFDLRGKEPLVTEVALSALEGNWDVSHQKATHELGFEPRPFDATMRDTLRWMYQAGLISQDETTSKSNFSKYPL